MPKKTKSALICLAIAMLAGSCVAQTDNAKPPEALKYFRLDFVVKEVESGKVINARNYSMIMAAKSVPDSFGTGSIRSGDKVPVKGNAAEYTYIDVGVNIDCRELREAQGKVALGVTADISTPVGDSPGRPVIRSTKWSSANVTLPLRKATILFTADDTESKRQMQLELTATPVL